MFTPVRWCRALTVRGFRVSLNARWGVVVQAQWLAESMYEERILVGVFAFALLLLPCLIDSFFGVHELGEEGCYCTSPLAHCVPLTD